MQDQDQDLEQDEGVEVPAQNAEGENNVLDPQTLENLADFLTRDNSEPREDHENDEERNKSEGNERLFEYILLLNFAGMSKRKSRLAKLIARAQEID